MEFGSCGANMGFAKPKQSGSLGSYDVLLTITILQLVANNFFLESSYGLE